MVRANNTAIIATATRLAEPRSSRFDRGHRLGCDRDRRQERRPRRDPRDDEFAVTPELNRSPVWRNALRRNGRRTVIPTRSEAGGLTRGIDATHLHRNRGEPRHTQHEHDDQGCDREGRLNGDTPGVIA